MRTGYDAVFILQEELSRINKRIADLHENVSNYREWINRDEENLTLLEDLRENLSFSIELLRGTGL